MLKCLRYYCFIEICYLCCVFMLFIAMTCLSYVDDMVAKTALCATGI